MFEDSSRSDDGEISPSSPSFEIPSQKAQVRICQHTSCTKQGAAEVLRAFQDAELADVAVVASGCLGCCGNGPMVLVQPDDIWNSHVTPADVKAIASQHLEDGIPVTQLLDRQHHERSPTPAPEAARSLTWAYIALAIAVLTAVTSIAWTVWFLA